MKQHIAVRAITDAKSARAVAKAIGSTKLYLTHEVLTKLAVECGYSWTTNGWLKVHIDGCYFHSVAELSDPYEHPELMKTPAPRWVAIGEGIKR